MSIVNEARSSAPAGVGAGQTKAPAPGSPAPGASGLEPTYEGDFVLDGHFELDCGRSLAAPTLHYAVYGRLDEARKNAVLVCHALSGSARVGDWWPEILSPGGALSLEYDCVLCVNLLGSCYGSTGPGSVDPETGKPFGPDFPLISIRDNVRAQTRLLDSLGIARLRLVLGGSIGGMQALEWAMVNADRVERAAIIAVAPLSAMGLALNHLQRLAIQQDLDWEGGRYLPQHPPRRGLALARQIAMLSYKSASLFDERFGRNPNRNGEDPRGVDDPNRTEGGGLIGGRFDIAGYLDHQGQRFIDRFDANAYLAILRTMETWDPLHGRSSPAEAFSSILARLTFVGISSDWLFPPQAVRQFAHSIRAAGCDADYREMTTDHGHDAFLAEQAELVRLLG
jgi:homoserine O-acetyltransferase